MIDLGEKASPQLEDPLAYLVQRGVVEYYRNQIIYDDRHPSTGLSLILRGRVKVSTLEHGSETVIGIFGEHEFFGESSLLGEHTSHFEQATALEKTALMTWSRDEIEARIETQPKLGVALIQVLVGRFLDSQDRLQSLALDATGKRVVLNLLRLAKSGTPQPDGAVRIPPLTHQLLARYSGTSREVVTSQLNDLRRQGMVRYSRQAIELYPNSLTEYLHSQYE